MRVQLNWVLNGSGKWHAWPVGGRSTFCQRINVEHLRQHGLTQIQASIPPGSAVCKRCAKGAGYVPPSDLTGILADWVGTLRRHLTHARVRVPEPQLLQLATMLAAVGGPTSPDALATFAQARILLLTPTYTRLGHARTVKTLPHLKAALSILAAHPGALAQVATGLRSWASITQRDPATDRFHADRVIDTMLKIPALEPYIQHQHARGFSHLSSMFHPNTLERAKKEPALRGLFAGSTDYWTNSHDQLNIVSD